MSPARHSTGALWPIDVAGAVACLVLTGAAYAIIVRPIAAERQAVASLRAELSTAQQRAIELDGSQTSLRDRLTRTRTELEANAVRLETADRLNHRLARVLVLASEAGLVINETHSGTVEHGDRYDTVPLEISGHGAYGNCADFLTRLCAHLPDVEVLGVRLSGQPSAPGVAPTFRFRLAWYAATSVAAAAPE